MMQRAEIENNAIAGIIRDTNIDLLGNSKGEKEEIVRRIRIPAIIAASVWIISLPLISSLVPDGFILKILIILYNIKYVCFCKTVELFKNKSLAYPFPPLCYALHLL
jgi:O-antigen ligase